MLTELYYAASKGDEETTRELLTKCIKELDCLQEEINLYFSEPIVGVDSSLFQKQVCELIDTLKIYRDNSFSDYYTLLCLNLKNKTGDII